MKSTILFACGITGLFALQALAGGGADQKKLEGSWAAASSEVSGKKLPQAMVDSNPTTMIFKGTKYTVKLRGNVEEEGTYRTDPGKKPATIDLMIETGSDKGKKQLGVYKVEGDTLTLHLAAPGARTRPTALSSKAGVQSQASVLKREAAKKE